MSDKCPRNVLLSVRVETAVWLFCSSILGSQGLDMHPTNCIFGGKNRILIRFEYSVSSNARRTLVSLDPFQIQKERGPVGEDKMKKMAIHLILLSTRGFQFQSAVVYWKLNQRLKEDEWYSCWRPQLWRKWAHSTSLLHFCSCGEHSLNLDRHHRASTSQVKHHILGSKLSLGWNQRRNILV